MASADPLFKVLRQTCPAALVDALADLVEKGPDHALNRINAPERAAAWGLPEDLVLGGFLHATRLGLFEMSWNVLCPGCGGVLESHAALQAVDQSSYHCALCAAGYEPTLDEMVEVTFTVSPRVRRIAAHDPDSLPLWDYVRQVFWGSGFDVPNEGFAEKIQEVVLEAIELPPGDKAIISLHLPAAFVIVFDPVTHTTQFIDVQGEPTRERQPLSLVFNEVGAYKGTTRLQPGPLRLTLQNDTGRRTLPGLWVAGDALHDLLGRRRPFLTAKRLLSHQVFRDLYRTGTMQVNQRLRITSLTFLFTDLEGSTAMYDRVGDLVAYDLVQEHFALLTDAVTAAGGAVVKTIGDAVMATFVSPDRAVAAALHMRRSIAAKNRERPEAPLRLNIGLHEGPCLAVLLNERQDYFGQTVNIAARVQDLADPASIIASRQVADDPDVRRLVAEAGLSPHAVRVPLRGVSQEADLVRFVAPEG